MVKIIAILHLDLMEIITILIKSKGIQNRSVGSHPNLLYCKPRTTDGDMDAGAEAVAGGRVHPGGGFCKGVRATLSM